VIVANASGGALAPPHSQENAMFKNDPDFKNHNSRLEEQLATLLRATIQDVTDAEQRISGIRDEIKALKAQAKAQGLDVKIMMKIIAEQKRPEGELIEERHLMEVYRNAIRGPQLPLEKKKDSLFETE
jgi:uncharacterized protein (UPF0335 family)